MKKIVSLSLAGVLATLALAGCNTSKLASQLANKLTIDSSYKQPSAGFLVPNSVLHEGQQYKVTWSEESDFIKLGNWDENFTKVAITRPAKGQENAKYDLVATLEAEGKKAKKTFSGVITAYAEDPITFTEVGKLYDDLKADTVKVNDEVEFTGLVAQINEAGIYTIGSDGEAIFTYGGDSAIKVGDEVKIVAKIAAYHSMYQFSDAKFEALSRGNEAKLKAYSDNEVSVAEIYDLDPQLGDKIHGKTMKMKGVMSVEKSGKYVNYYLKDLNNGSKKHQIYYKTTSKELAEKFEAQDGQVVTYDVIYYTNDYHGKAYLIYNGDEENLPAGSVLAGNDLFHFEASQYRVPKTIAGNLPTEFEWVVGKNEDGTDKKEKATISYVAEPAGLISTTGKVTVKAEPVDLTKLEITITKGEGADKVEHKLSAKATVGIDKYSKLVDIMKNKNTNSTFVKGVVLANPSFQDYLIYNEGGVFLVRTDKDTVKKINIGDEVTFQGKYSAYEGVQQYATESLIISKKAEKMPEVDFAKVAALDTSKIKAAVDAKVKPADAETNENTKAAFKQINTLVKVTGTMGSKYLTVEGMQVNCDKELIKAAGIAEGDKFEAYCVFSGFHEKGGVIDKGKAYTLKIVKVAA